MSRSFNQPPVILEIFYDITLEKGLGYLITVWRLQKPHLTSQPLSGWILMGQYFFLKCLDGIEWAKCDLLSCWTAHQMNIWLEHNLVFLCHFFWSSTIGVSRLPASTLESGIHEARRKQNKVITVLFLESQVPQLASYFLSVFQSCLMFVLHITSGFKLYLSFTTPSFQKMNSRHIFKQGKFCSFLWKVAFIQRDIRYTL